MSWYLWIVVLLSIYVASKGPKEFFRLPSFYERLRTINETVGLLLSIVVIFGANKFFLNLNDMILTALVYLLIVMYSFAIITSYLEYSPKIRNTPETREKAILKAVEKSRESNKTDMEHVIAAFETAERLQKGRMVFFLVAQVFLLPFLVAIISGLSFLY